MVERRSKLVCRAAAILAVLGGCATPDVAHVEEKGQGKSPTAVPQNYRQLVASKILERTDRQKIRRAQISRPQVAWVGLLQGGNRPVVCAVIFRETPLFAEGRDCWLVTFQDGKVATAGYSYAGCDCADMLPFNEVLPRK
jgi:hypothetical protein